EASEPVAAGSPGRSWVGAVDLIGNAWEWTAAAASDARGQPGHVIKGGAFDTPSANATAAYRAVLPDRRAWLTHTGFRCARSVAVVPERVAAPSSVAVLYFETPDTASAYLADGLTEAIITSLGRVDRLSVQSRNARSLRSLPARELRARTADAARGASGDRPIPGRPAARSGLHARPRPGGRRLRAVPRLGVGVSRPVSGGGAVSRVRRG